MTVALYHQSIVRKNITWIYCIVTIAEIEKLIMFLDALLQLAHLRVFQIFLYKNFCMKIVQELRRQKEMQGIIMQYLE